MPEHTGEAEAPTNLCLTCANADWHDRICKMDKEAIDGEWVSMCPHYEEEKDEK